MQPGTLKQLGVLMATVFVDMIGFLIVQPTLPFYAKALGARPAIVTLVMAAFAFAQLLTAPLWGRLSDRLGRRPMLLCGLMISAVAFALFGLATSIWLLFLFRLVQGAGGGTTGVVQAYVSDSVPPADRAKALGWITAATSAGVMVGPLLGSLATYLGRSGPGFVAAGLCLLNVLSAWRWLPESKRREEAPAPGSPAAAPRQPLRRAMLDVMRHPGSPVSALIWIYAVGMMAFMAMNGVLALYLGDAYGVTEKTIGWFYTYVGGVSLVMRALLLGKAVRRFGEIGVTRLGALSLVLGLACIPLPALMGSAMPVRLAALALVVLFVPVGTALLFPATTALVSSRAPRTETGQVMGVQQAFGGVARLLGPVWAGVVFERDIRYPFWCAAALMLAVTFLTARLRAAEKPAAEPILAAVEPR
jgi:MFS family permease